MVDRERKINRPEVLLSSSLQSSGRLNAEPDGRTMKRELSLFNETELTTFTQLLLHGLGTENEYWTVDRRDAALRLLSFIPLINITPNRLLNMYLQEIRRLEQSSDPLGNVYSVLEAGGILAPFLPPKKETINTITQIWTETGQGLSDQDGWSNVSSKVDDIVDAIKYPSEKYNPYIITIFDGEINSPYPNAEQLPLPNRKLAELRRKRVTKMREDGISRKKMAEMEGERFSTIANDITKLLSGGEIQARIILPNNIKARRHALREEIEKEGGVSPAAFSREWGVAPHTVKRDIAYLQSKGDIGDDVIKGGRPAPTREARRHALREEIEKEGGVSPAAFSREWGVNNATVRHDIRVLQRKGDIGDDVIKGGRSASKREARRRALREELRTNRRFSFRLFAKKWKVSQSTVVYDKKALQERGDL